jgi:hypothetical protein
MKHCKTCMCEAAETVRCEKCGGLLPPARCANRAKCHSLSQDIVLPSCPLVWTASEPVYRRLPKQGHAPKEDGERSATFEVPKRSVVIKTRKVLTDKQREALQKHSFSSGSTGLSRESDALRPASGGKPCPA